jgi:protein gp37
MKNSHIEWCDHTFNPWIGCTKVDELCKNCYAWTRDMRFSEGIHWGPGAPRQRTSPANWRQPIIWNETHAAGVELRGHYPRQRVFCASLADWLDDEVPIEWLADLMHLIWATPNLDWLLLTKRPENFQRRLSEAYLSQPGATGHSLMMALWNSGQPTAPANVWIGTSVGHQKSADERIPALLKIPAKVHFLSCEPLLGPVDLGCTCWLSDNTLPNNTCRNCHKPRHCSPGRVDWVICGGESGRGARPMHPDWARSLRDQCNATATPFFFKQWGEWCPTVQKDNKVEAVFPVGTVVPDRPHFEQFDDGLTMIRVGKLAAGRLLDGKEHSARPTVDLTPAR